MLSPPFSNQNVQSSWQFSLAEHIIFKVPLFLNIHKLYWVWVPYGSWWSCVLLSFLYPALSLTDCSLFAVCLETHTGTMLFRLGVISLHLTRFILSTQYRHRRTIPFQDFHWQGPRTWTPHDQIAQILISYDFNIFLLLKEIRLTVRAVYLPCSALGCVWIKRI